MRILFDLFAVRLNLNMLSSGWVHLLVLAVALSKIKMFSIHGVLTQGKEADDKIWVVVGVNKVLWK